MPGSNCESKIRVKMLKISLNTWTVCSGDYFHSLPDLVSKITQNINQINEKHFIHFAWLEKNNEMWTLKTELLLYSFPFTSYLVNPTEKVLKMNLTLKILGG